jgi:hypothetical protein
MMPWITLPKALEHVGGDKDRLQAALAAGDVKSRIRREDGTVQSLSPKKWRRGAEVDWEGSRLAVTKREYVTSWDNDPPRFVSVEVDLCTLLESFPAHHSFITLGETLELIAFGGPAPADESALKLWDAAEEQLICRAGVGELTGYGLWNGRGEYQRIPAGFWPAAILSPTDDRGWLTKPEYPKHLPREYRETLSPDYRDEWTDIKFDRRDVRRLWPTPIWACRITEKRPPIRTSGSEKRCREWLESIMAERQRPDKAKGVYMAQAKEKYCVSDRGFKRAWEQAKANTGATAWGWGKAGAKPRANQSTKSRHRIDSPM